MLRFVEREWREHLLLMEGLSRVFDDMVAMAEGLRGVLEMGGKLLVFGNGGSAASAQHFASELTGRLVEGDEKHFSALALTTDAFLLTALANDFGYREVFSRQVEVLGRPGDMAVGITTSGASPNVLEALDVACRKGLATAALTGEDGLSMGKVDVEIRVPSRHTPRIQEVHDFILHTVAMLVKSD